MITRLMLVLLVLSVLLQGCATQQKAEAKKMKILIDTDANNELDDQHALAYAFLNTDVFDVVGVTVNNTRNGYGIQG
ncbi:hypothetical protein [uncultured Draconibacterium sp.]|uniref:hypothetical protein n=1 Tax=uncultured Draconibacterium sp. TaxID=1573823 RepID=UPI0029C92827|nr:hypothetical protein [uncultured Draconibacterium sp.]